MNEILKALYDNFYEELPAPQLKAEIEHCLYILEKIGIRVCERTPHIVILALASLNELLELGYDLIEASVARVVNSEAVVYFFSAVEAEDYVAHLTVGKIYNVVVNKHTVGSESEAEILVVLFLNASRVRDELLYNVKIHKRLSAKEIDLEIVTCA